MKTRLPSLAALFVVACITPTAHAQEEKAAPELKTPMAKALYEALKSPKGYDHGGDLKRFYEARNYMPLWIEADGDRINTPKGMIAAIEDADEDGLNPEAYQLEEVANQAPLAPTTEAAVAYELKVSDEAMDYVQAIRYGAIKPQTVFPKFFTPDDKNDLAWPMEQIIEAGGDEDAVKAQAPQSSEYARLREALKDYRTIAAHGGWKDIPTGETIKPGQVDERIPLIRDRLRLLGRLDGQNSVFDTLRTRFASMTSKDDTKAETEKTEPVKLSKKEEALAKENPDWVYNEDLEPAIREFQERRGATADGVIGPETMGELNVPVEDRITQILLAMEQWRWLPKDLGNKYVFVNTAGYYAKGVQNNKVVVNTPVIVGQVAHPTPSFSSYITNVKFYPDWTVPDSIAKRYVMDKIRKNPAVVNTLGYQLLDENGAEVPLNSNTIANLNDGMFPPYRFRQKPGVDNALGLVRFSVDNDYAIYLHDTPKDALFAENNRNFSSGCVRVGEPVKMAQFLLEGNSDMSAGEVARKFDVAGRTDLETEIIPMENKVPVHILYMTAWVDESGDVRFESDPYGRDAKLKAALGM